MRESLFAALRIAAQILKADGQVAPEENKWLRSIINVYGLTSAQREVLRSDAVNGLDIRKVYAEITNVADRERLISLAGVALKLDGAIVAEEKRLFNLLKELNQRAGPQSREYQDLAREILTNDKETQMWKDLEEVGSHYSKRHDSIDTYSIPVAAFDFIVRSLTSPNRYVVWVMLVILAVAIFSRFMVT